MIPREVESKIDCTHDGLWSRGVSNSLEVIEQIMLPLNVRRLVDLRAFAEKKVRVAGGLIESPSFLLAQAYLPSSQLKNPSPEVKHKTIAAELTRNGVAEHRRLFGSPSTDHSPTGPDYFRRAVDVIVEILVHTKQTPLREEVA